MVKPTQQDDVQSEVQLDMMVQLMDMLVRYSTLTTCNTCELASAQIQLDALKDMKACLLNDFSRYKR